MRTPPIGAEVFDAGTDRLGGANHRDALAAHFAANLPVAPPPLERVMRLPRRVWGAGAAETERGIKLLPVAPLATTAMVGPA